MNELDGSTPSMLFDGTKRQPKLRPTLKRTQPPPSPPLERPVEAEWVSLGERFFDGLDACLTASGRIAIEMYPCQLRSFRVQ